MKTYYQIQTDDWSDDNRFATLRDAKNHIWSNYTQRELVRAFNEYHKASIDKCREDGDDIVILSCTPFYCDEKGTHYGRTVKVVY